MEQYISKSALVAEIEKKYNKEEDWMNKQGYTDYHIGLRDAYKDLRDLVDNFKVKEVDLEKEYKDFVEEDLVYNKLVNGIVGNAIAKHFFELGLKAQKGE